MAGLSPTERDRLRDALKENYRQGAELRKLRADCIRLFAGSDYPDSDNDEFEDIVNRMRQAAIAQIISLASNRPRALVTTHNPGLKAWAKKKSRTLDTYSKMLRLERVLQRCAMGGFFGLGVGKVAMLETPQVFLRAHPFAQIGRPGVLDVSLDHLCWDMEGADFDCLSFIGDRYRIRYEDAIHDKRFPYEAREKLKQSGPEMLGSAQGADWAEEIARAGNNKIQRFEDWVYFTDVFVPSRQCIYTFGCNADWELTTDELTHVEWKGKPTGCYSIFSLGQVLGNTKPSCPAQQLRKLHNLLNTVYRKIRDGINDLKDVFLTPTGNEGDAMRIRSALNLQIVPVDQLGQFQRESFGGPNQQLVGISYKLEDIFSEAGGNIEHRLGNGAQADTATQEAMIGRNVAGVTAYEQGLFADFVREIYQELSNLLDRDAVTRIPMMATVPGTQIPVPDDWEPLTIGGSRPEIDGKPADSSEFDVDIEPHDMPYKSPMVQAEECRQIWNEQAPMWEAMSQQGVQPDIGAYLDSQARLRSNTHIREMFKFNQPIPPMDAARERPSTSAANKPGGKYQHTSVSGNGGDRRGEIMGMMRAPAQNGAA